MSSPAGQTGHEPPRRRKRVLFFAEAVTLAHVARPLVLAEQLPASDYETILAADPRYEKLYTTSPVQRVPISSIPSEQFARALQRGNPIYTASALEGYVQEDLRVIRECQPDFIVGDMRLSLAVSARLAGVRYATITNSYWSPYAQVKHEIPEGPLTHGLGVGLGQRLFDLVRPMVYALHCRPMNRVLKNHGLAPLGNQLQRVYTEADVTLYADLPGLTPMSTLPANHRHIGPILWEPDLPLPAWWDNLPTDQPVVYVNLGSSGPSRLLKLVLEGLAKLDVTVIAATAGKAIVDHPPANARLTAYLPGLKACEKANLVICNGGSPSTQQALAAGKPMLCLPSNLDQLLNTQAMVNAGVAIRVRADQAKAERIGEAVTLLLQQSGYREKASMLQDALKRESPIHELQRVLENQ